MLGEGPNLLYRVRSEGGSPRTKVLRGRVGFVSCKKKNRNAKNMASEEREPIWGSGGGAPSGVQGQSPWSGSQGAKPPEAEGILLPKRANLSLSFK